MPLGTKLFSVSLAAFAALATTAGTARATTTVSNSADVTKTNAASDWASKSTSFGSFGAGYSASWTFYSKSDGTSMYEKAEASASGQLFGAKFSMVDLWAMASSGTSSTVTGSYELDILGKQILSGSPSLSSTLNNLSLEKGYSIVKIEQTIEVGVPITLTLESDLTAALGLTATSAYSSGASSLSFTGTPSVGVGLTASVGVGVSFASAGVEGSVTLLNVSTPITNSLSYTASGQSLSYSTTGVLTLSELSGTFDLYAQVEWLGVALKYTYQLFSWNGLSQSVVLFSDSLPVASAVQMTVFGYQATGVYTFTDAGGLTESGSTYRVSRADDANGTNATDVGTSSTWNLATADNRKFLRFCVTPKTTTNGGTESCSGWSSVGPLAEFYKDNLSGTNLNYAYQSNYSGACWTFPSSFNDVASSFNWYADQSSSTQLVLYINQYCSIYGADTIRSLSAGGSESIYSMNASLGGSWNDSVTSFRVLWDDTVSASSVTVSISGATATESYHYGDSGNVNEAGSTYAWQRADDASGTNVTTIRTTSGSWSLSASDNQKYLRFCVTPSNGINAGAQTCSAWEAVGHLVELYKDSSYGGSSVHLAYERSSAQTCFNLGDYGFNDVVSSFHFEGVSGGASTVEMFYDGSCSGNTAYYTSSTGGGSYSMNSLNSYWNDAISSLKVYY